MYNPREAFRISERIAYTKDARERVNAVQKRKSINMHTGSEATTLAMARRILLVAPLFRPTVDVEQRPRVRTHI